MSYKKAVIISMAVAVFFVGLSTVAVADNHSSEAKAYAGTHVSFDTSENGVVNYTVDGTTVFESAEVESRSSAESRGAGGIGVGVGGSLDLSALTDVQGAAVANVNAEARASANVEFEGSTEFEAHDNGNGVAVLKSGGEEQVVEVEIGADTEAETAEESVVSFTSNGTESSFIVAGEGEAEVNEDGNVAAHLESNTNAVVRAYGETKTEDDEQQETLIAEGDVAAEVQFTDDGEETVGSSAEFLSNTTVDITNEAENSVTLTVDRAQSDGKAVMTTVTDGAVGTTENLYVSVDGEAAVEAQSYSELEGGIGNEPRYLVVDGETEGKAQVLVAVDSFSEHDITVEGEETDGETDSGEDTNETDDTDDGEQTDGDETTDDGEQMDGDEDTNETDSTDGGGTMDDGESMDGNESMDGSEQMDDGEDMNETDGMDEGEQSEDGGNESEEDSGGEGLPGFTVVAALVAMLAVVAVRVRE